MFLLAILVLTSCDWRGIANVPLPIGRGAGPNRMTIYVPMPDKVKGVIATAWGDIKDASGKPVAYK